MVDEMTARVLVVEHHKLIRQGIRSEVTSGGAEVVGEAATGAEAVAAATERRPDVVVLGDTLTDRTGAEVCAAILRRHPAAAIIVVSRQRDEASVRAALDAGARGYLVEDDGDIDLPHAIERVLAGESVIDRRIAAALFSRDRPDQPKLSGQELKVLQLVAEGLTNPEIGTRMYLSRHTVKEYVSHAMRKLEASNRIEAVRKATALGLIGGVGSVHGNETQPRRDSLVYNESNVPARASDLKVTPIKIDRLKSRPEAR
jgi:DNA-binding NarL/FixJ family response regulator